MIILFSAVFMGIKDSILNKIMNKMVSKMMRNVDMSAIKRNAKDGKYDIDQVKEMMEKFIGKEASDSMVEELKRKAENGEKISMSMIMGMIKRIDLSKIKDDAESGKITSENIQSALTELVGEKQTQKIFSEAADVAKEISEEEKNNK
jgi:hypothetical protein